jgi:hypothetical protein
MIVWLWDAYGPVRGGRGITSDKTRAVKAAEACMRSGDAVVARVESAQVILGTDSLTSGYLRTGEGLAGRCGDTGVRWDSLAQQATSPQASG